MRRPHPSGDCSPSRRQVLRAAAVAPAWCLLPHTLRAASEFAVVDTDRGRVRGERQADLCVFRGIPFAGAPTGAHRFRAAPALAPWTGVRDALALGHPSIQAPGGPMGINEPAPDEDCLVLNIWTPAVNDAGKRPVMFYLHGGGFSTGSGGSQHQDGANLARLNDVVVVQCNHRLGLLGHLYLGELLGEAYRDSGNLSLLDILAALDWTRRNIAAFGGDPDNVMVWGESGGGAKTSAVYAMPAAAGYFNKASIESGPGIHMTERDLATRTARWVLERLGLSPAQARRLHEVPAATLLEIQLSPPPGGPALATAGRRGIGSAAFGGFAPVIDGHVLPAHPFDPRAPAVSADKPLICGYNHDEAVFFHAYSPDHSAFSLDEPGLRQRLAGEYGPHAGPLLYATYRRSRPDASPSQLLMAIESAGIMGAGSIAIAEAKAQQQRAPVYAYVLTEHLSTRVPGTNYPVGAMHAMDIRYKFDNVASQRPNPGQTPEELADHLQAAKNMSRLWAGFARTGRPAAPGVPDWPAYDLERRATMMIAAQAHVEADPYPQERAAWEALEGRIPG